MSFKRYGSAHTLVFEPKNNIPIYVASKQSTVDSGDGVADTGAADDWIRSVKLKKARAGEGYLGDTGWSDTGYPQLENKGTVLDLYARYDSGSGEGGDWDKKSYRVDKS
jgi:hypothetical protein